MRDECFIRGNVPMTKSEVRAISLAKLELRTDSVVYDVGAGTGSVTVEAALAAYDGQVFAFEKKEEACGLIRANCERFGIDHVTLLEGDAREYLTADPIRPLPPPDAVFIGGTDGGMEELLDAVRAYNPKARVVLNVVTLESLSQAQTYCRSRGIEPEVVLVQISHARCAGRYHMMTGQNPVYIISWGESRWDRYLE